MVSRPTHPAPAALYRPGAGMGPDSEEMEMLELMGLLYMLGMLCLLLLVGGAVAAVIEAITREWT